MKHITVPNMNEDEIISDVLINQLSQNYDVKYSKKT